MGAHDVTPATSVDLILLGLDEIVAAVKSEAARADKGEALLAQIAADVRAGSDHNGEQAEISALDAFEQIAEMLDRAGYDVR